MTWIARHIRHYDVPIYKRNGWRVTFYGVRGDGLHCFLATFQCCEAV